MATLQDALIQSGAIELGKTKKGTRRKSRIRCKGGCTGPKGGARYIEVGSKGYDVGLCDECAEHVKFGQAVFHRPPTRKPFNEPYWMRRRA